MVVTLKLVSTAFDVADGAAPSAAHSAHQVASRLPRRPSLLEYAVRRAGGVAWRGVWSAAASRALGPRLVALRIRAFLLIRLSLFAQSYVLYPGTLLAGPWVPFAEYAAFIERKGVRRRTLRRCAHAAPR